GRSAEVKDASIRHWEAATGREVGRFPEDPSGQPMEAAALSADGKTLALGVRDSIGLVDVSSRGLVGRLHMPSGHIACVRFSPDGKRLAVIFEFVAKACLFDLETRRMLWQTKVLANDYSIQSVEFAPDGRSLAVFTTTKEPMRLLDASN